MSFINFLSDFSKRTVFFIVGFLFLPVGAYVMDIGSTPGKGVIPVNESNPISALIGLVVMFIGLAMMVYAFKK